MRRREFIASLATAAAWPIATLAQKEGLRRLGVLLALPENDPEVRVRVEAFRRELANRGWTEGRNFWSDYRWAGADAGQARAYASELAASKPDVLFAAPTSIAAALQRETRSIPIVFAQVADPVGAGLVASLAHPGGNITGFSHFEFPFAAKWLELLKEIAPNVRRAAVIYDPANPAATGYLPLLEAAARAYAVDVQPSAVRDGAGIERAVAALAREPNGGMILIPSPILGTQRELIVSLCNQHRLPSVHPFRYHPAGGGLASYGVDLVDLYRHAASYVDRILRGEKAADLPVQAPTKHELVINLKTAQALGLEVPATVLARADEVIE